MIPTLFTVAIAWTRAADVLEAVGARITVLFARLNSVRRNGFRLIRTAVIDFYNGLLSGIALWRARLRTARAYKSRHRKGFTPPPLVHWMDDYRARITHWIVTHAQPVMDEDWRPAAGVAALREPTQEMPVPDFDSDVEPYHHELGPGRMSNLRDEPLAASAARAEKILLIRTESYPLRGAAPTYGEIGDKEYAEARHG